MQPKAVCKAAWLLDMSFCRLAEDCYTTMGGAIGFWQGKVPLLVDDLAALKPTIFIAVPRVLDRIYQKVTDQVSSRQQAMFS